ncbi:MAG: uncharacterized protein QOF36_1009 [Microbacteriaceae bacterium]|jgi:uncharacterized Tic20 family protein|nr:uncharacterized protein [Microbacteriaceae bacterium]
MTDPNAQPPYDPASGQPQQPYQGQQPQQPYQGQPPQQPYQGAPAQAAPLAANEDRQWAMWSHFGGVIGILPSLIIFLVFKDRGRLTNQEAKEALNWQITFTIGYIILIILGAILNTLLIVAGVGFLALIISLLPLFWWILNVIFSIMGGVKVNAGGSYRYPFAIRLIK